LAESKGDAMRRRINQRIDWIHLGTLAFCVTAWAAFAVVGLRVSESGRVRHVFDHLKQIERPMFGDIKQD